MDFDKSFEDALKSFEPSKKLTSLALELASKGFGKDAVYQIFDLFRAKLRLAEREDDEDLVMDTMDCIVGWCAPKHRIYPENW